MTVPLSNLLAMTFTLVVSCVLPFVLWFFCSRKTEGTLKPVLAGTVGYFLAELLLRIPFLQALSSLGAFSWQAAAPVPYLLLLSLTASLVEMLARMLVLKTVFQGQYSYYGGIAVGIGHAGMEALALVSLNYMSYITVSMLINTGHSDNVTDLEQTLQTLAEPSWTEFFAIGLQRVLVIVIQIGLTVLICRFLAEKKIKSGFWICTAVQFVYLFLTQLLVNYAGSTWISVAFLLVCAAGAVWLMISQREKFAMLKIASGRERR